MQNVDSVYALSPMQQAMLVRTLQIPGLEEYTEHVVWTVTGELDAAALGRSWQRLVDRHGILRTVFFWEGLDQPVQVVRKRVAAPFEVLDWRDVPEDRREERFAALLADDRARGFDPASAPLARILCVRLGDREHRVAWSHSHLLLDGWSSSLGLRELFVCYAAFVEGAEPELPRAVPYQDFVAWLAGRSEAGAEAFWRARLAGFDAPTRLPVERPAGRGAAEVPEVLRARIPEAALARVREAARRHGITLNTVLQGAWGLLLSRYSGERDVVFGTVVSGRPPSLPGVEAALGMFVNTVPARVRVRPGAPAAAWLREIQEEQTGSREHDWVSVPRIQSWSEVPPPERLYDTLYTFQNVPDIATGGAAAGGAEWSGFYRDAAAVRSAFGLNLEFVPRDGLELILLFDAARFDRGFVEDVPRHLEAVLEAFAARPERPVDGISLLTPAERGAVLDAGAAPRRDFPRGECVHERVAARAALVPAAPAVVSGARTLTYAELDGQANRLANHLRRLGVGPEARVAVCLERAPEMLLAVLAVLKAGGAYVPLDPEYPAERLSYVAEDCGARVVVTLAHRAEAFAAVDGVTVLLDADAPALAAESAEAPESGTAPENAAYVIYTSGTTGRPKGVVVSHRSLVNYADAAREAYGIGAGDRVLQFASLAFDASAEEIYPALFGGAAVVLRTPDLFGGVAPFLERCGALGITVLDLPTAFWHEVVEELGAGARLPDSVRLVVIGGERALPERVAAWRARVGGDVRLSNTYGPTETTIVATAADLATGPAADAGVAVSIGRPVANARAYVLDRDGGLLPAGVPGELYVGGEGVARGYLGRPDLTAERFVPDPFSAEPGARAYRTGDLVRRLRDGSLEFVGRLDHQVKVRGFRVEPAEVAARLLDHPAVRDAAVVAREDRPGEGRLVAYVVADPASEPSADALRDHLRAALPEYMVPAAFVALDAFPRTPGGKTDLRALPAPGLETEAAAPVSPRTPTEEALAAIWAEVLGVERVGVRDDFFRLGGHSLLAVRVASRVLRALDVELPVAALFEAPTVEAMAERVEALRREAGAPSAPPVVPVPRDGPLPLSFAQQRLWFIDQLDPGDPTYNLPLALRLRGALDVDALERAVAEVARRHEVLRTVFRAGADGEAEQVVREPGPFTFRREDLSGLAAPEREARVEERIREEAAAPFDLSTGPLLRGAVLRLAEDEAVALFTLHHVVADEWSTPILVREVSALYGAFAAVAPSPLPELPVQYADYAVWQRGWLTGDVLDRQLTYWRDRLAGAPPLLELPTDRPRPAVASPEGGVRPLRLDPALGRSLRALSREEGTTAFMTLLAGFQALLGRYAGTDDVSVGTPVAGRTRLETEGLIGFFVNTLVMRAEMGADLTARGLLSQARTRTLEAQAHQDLPFERLVDELKAGRAFGHTPLFQVMFTLADGGGEALRLGDVEVEPLETETGATPFDLALVLGEDADGGYRGTVEYRAELWDPATVDRMSDHLRVLLEGMAARPDARVAALPLLGPAERGQVLEAWNDTSYDFPRDLCIHEVISEQARRTPDAPAVIMEGSSLSYAELDARAGHVAALLSGLGAGPEARVGISFARGPEMPAAILGVLRAGAAYVPLDPAYPPDRLRHMLEDSGARVLLTQEEFAGRFAWFGGEVVVAPSPPGPLSPASGRKGGNETPEGEDRSEPVGGSPPPPAPPPQAREGSMTMPPLTSSPPPVGEGWREAPGWGAAAVPSVEVSPDNLAYVIYTSGSTGRPKGVAVSHRAVVNFAADMAARLGLRPDDRVLQFASLSFDVVVEELFPAWFAGAAVVLAEGDLFSPPELTRAIGRHGVTGLELPTAYWHEWTHELTHGGARLPECVRWVIVGGERVAPERLAEWAAVGVPLVHVFGLTETACTSATLRLEAGEDGSARWPNLPVGTPHGNVRLYVLDPEGESMPVGVPGELRIGGAGLARGYLGRPDLTAERFVPDPFSRAPGARLYRTGDRVRWLADGNLEFIGRIDHQVKIRGFRVETGEVEAVLMEHAGVREAFVMAREDAPGEKRLAAYVVPEDPAAPDAAELRGWLRERLPEYMVPSAWVTLDALPLTPNGKVDRAALPAPDASAGAGEYMPPRNATEEVLADLWSSLLGVERVGIHDDFFALGGHSLLATRVVTRTRQMLHVEVPLRVLFETPTVAGLAEALLRLEPRPGQTEKAARMLRLVAGMSPEEVQRMLRERQAAAGR